MPKPIASVHYLTGKQFPTVRICDCCHTSFHETPACWCGPNEDIPTCESCRETPDEFMAKLEKIGDSIAETARELDKHPEWNTTRAPWGRRS